MLYSGLHTRPWSHLLCGGPGLDSSASSLPTGFCFCLPCARAMSRALCRIQDLTCCPPLLGCLPHPLSYSLGPGLRSRTLTPHEVDTQSLKNTEATAFLHQGSHGEVHRSRCLWLWECLAVLEKTGCALGMKPVLAML